jgi:DNA end-binding protein Ku
LGQQPGIRSSAAEAAGIIEAKRKKTKRPATAKASEPEATPNNVINIMDALRRSVKAEKRPDKPN